MHVLPVPGIYADGTSHPYASGLLWRFVSPLLPEGRKREPHLSYEEVESLVETRFESDYLVLSNRLTDQLEAVRSTIEVQPDNGLYRVLEYYDSLLGGRSSYRLAKTFESRPGLWGFSIDDHGAEYAFKIVDHPTIFIYKRARAGDGVP